ncbi:MAG: PDZ domain-containing protein [Phycisphaerales bacterium]|nr:PDZ domain-containing protein [Phycisphaerales bacterium]
MNLIFGLIFFIIAFMHGVEFPPAIVGSVAPGSPASQAQLVGSNNPESIGLKAGDRVIRIDDTEVGDFMDLAVNTALAGADHTLTLQVLREGHEQPLSFKAKPVRDPVMGLLSLGIGQTLSPKIAATDAEELPQAWVQAGVQPGWFVTQAGGKAVGLEEFHKYTQAVIAGRGEPVSLVFADDISNASKTVETTLTAWPLLTAGDEAKGAMHLLGLEPVVMITALSPQGPAESAGVQPGDLLAELDGVDWPGIARVPQIVKAANGKAISIAVVRDGQRVELPAVKPNAKGFIGIVQSLALMIICWVARC